MHRNTLAAAVLAALMTSTACAPSASEECKGASTECGGTCVDLQSDNLHCGACGRACGAGSACRGGTCSTAAPACPPGEILCGSRCVDPLSDRLFCGSSGSCGGGQAGVACAAGEVCSAGVCALSCQAGLTGCAGTCRDLQSDRAHCGACGRACAPGEICDSGACALSCGGGTTQCGSACVRLASDPAHCGACNRACAAGEVCSAGTCVTGCPPGEHACGGGCIDPASDPGYCGAGSDCLGGASCGPNAACYQGSCEPLCAAGQVMCDGSCINPLSSATHCGASGYCTGPSAGRSCGAFQACSAGACVCTGGRVMCGGSCIDPLTDPAFCGARGTCAGADAGTACLPSQTCVAGTCSPPPCSWQQVLAADLASLPGGAHLRKGADGSQGPALVSGRAAWLQTSDWAYLFLPTGLPAAMDTGAFAADFFLPPPGTEERQVGIGAYLEPPTWAEPTPWKDGGGVEARITATPAGAARVDWYVYPGSETVPVASTPVAVDVVGAWHRMRLESLRSACRFRLLVDGTPVSTWTGACTATGTQMFVFSGNFGRPGSPNAAWSNLVIEAGNGSACVP